MSFRKIATVMAFLCLPHILHCQLSNMNRPSDFHRGFVTTCMDIRLLQEGREKLTVMCSQNPFNVSDILKCTNDVQFKTIILIDCIFSSSDIGMGLENYQPDVLSLTVDKGWKHGENEVIIKNMPNLKDLKLSINFDVRYQLETLPSLESIELFRISTSGIAEDIFFNLTSLQKIVLQQGNFSQISVKTFRGLHRLTHLYLVDNQLISLPETVFDGLDALEELYITKNQLTSLPSKIFYGLTQLKKLYISSNNLTTLPSNLVEQNVNIKYITIEENISFLPPEFLNRSEKIEGFQATNGNISQLPETLFSSSTLTSILLSRNKLSLLHPNLFVNSKVIDHLDLSENQLKTLPEEIFRNTNIVTYLDLSNNRIENIPNNIFENTIVVELFLKNNRLVNIEIFNRNRPSGSFTHRINQNGAFRRVDLSGNDLISFPSVDWKVYKLNIFDLSSNNIDFVDLEELPPNRHPIINLRFNKIRTVKVASNYTYLNNILIEGNPLNCNCALRNFVDAVQHSRSHWSPIYCSSPWAYRHKALFDIVPSSILCSIRENCPSGCRCYQEKDLTVIVNCSSIRLNQSPKFLPANAAVVHLESNRLTNINVIGPLWKSVVRLNLDNNVLDPKGNWHFPSSLKSLSIRSNGLISLPGMFLYYVDSSTSLELDLGDNRFRCDCQDATSAFKKWLKRNIRKIKHAEDITCRMIVPANNTELVYSFISIPLKDLCKKPPKQPNYTLVVSISVASSLLFLILLFLLLFFIYRDTIFAWFYVHVTCLFTNERSEHDKMYDAFISYTRADKPVTEAILDELEENYPYFKLCAHQRDWRAGSSVLSQFERSINWSKKIIIVISENFLASRWCRKEFQNAYLRLLEDKTERIFVVTVGNPSKKAISQLPMYKLLAKRPFLKWNGMFFWERLRYHMPHNIDGLSGDYVITDLQRKEWAK